jgi:hypothetical protein
MLFFNHTKPVGRAPEMNKNAYRPLGRPRPDQILLGLDHDR